MIITVTCLSVVDNLITLRVSPQQVYSNCIIQIAEYNIYNTMIKSWTNVTTLTSLNQIIEYTFTLFEYSNAVMNASKIGVRLISTNCLGGSESGCIECISDSYILNVCNINGSGSESGSGGSGEGCSSGLGLCPVLPDNFSLGKIKGYGLLAGYESTDDFIFSKIENEEYFWEGSTELVFTEDTNCKIKTYCKIKCENGHLVDTDDSTMECLGSGNPVVDTDLFGLGQIITINGIPHVQSMLVTMSSSDPDYSSFVTCLGSCKCESNCDDPPNPELVPINPVNNPKLIAAVNNNIVIAKFIPENVDCTGCYSVSANGVVVDDNGINYANIVLIEWLDSDTMTVLGTGSSFSECEMTNSKTLLARFSCPNSNISTQILPVNITVDQCPCDACENTNSNCYSILGPGVDIDITDCTGIQKPYPLCAGKVYIGFQTGDLTDRLIVSAGSQVLLDTGFVVHGGSDWRENPASRVFGEYYFCKPENVTAVNIQVIVGPYGGGWILKVGNCLISDCD